MEIPVIVLLLQGIPEGTALTTLALVISGIALKVNKILLIGTALAVCAFILRLFFTSFGIHTILTMFALFIVLNILSKEDIGLSFMASLLSSLALIISETACFPLLKFISSITPKALATYHFDRILLGEIHVIFLFILAFLLNRTIQKKSLKTPY